MDRSVRSCFIDLYDDRHGSPLLLLCNSGVKSKKVVSLKSTWAIQWDPVSKNQVLTPRELTCKHKKLSLLLRCRMRKASVVVHACDPSQCWGQSQLDPEASQPTSLACLRRSSPLRDPVSPHPRHTCTYTCEHRPEEQHPRLFYTLHIGTLIRPRAVMG